MTKKDAALLRQQDGLQSNAVRERTDSIPNPPEGVKPNALRDLRLKSCASVRDMVEIVRGIYPKYDKTLQSKCEHSDEYGVELRPDAMNALLDAFAPDTAPQPRRHDFRRMPCRIHGRVTEDLYKLLQQTMEGDGYATMQDWVFAIVKWYTAKKQQDSTFSLERSN